MVPAWTAAIRDMATDLGWTLIEADAGSIPMPLRVLHPERVGSDRLLAAWTARELFGAPVIVVDIGTATTIDVVDDEGAFVGGAIMPGPELAMRSLARGHGTAAEGGRPGAGAGHRPGHRGGHPVWRRPRAPAPRSRVSWRA